MTTNILSGLAAAIFLCLLAFISYIDLRTMKIPNRLTIALGMTGLAALFVQSDELIPDRLLGMLAVSLPMLTAALLFPGSLGGGDIKLMAAGGLWLGVKGIFYAAAIGMAAAGVYGFILLFLKKAGRKDVFALGPFLCAGIGTVFVILCIQGSYPII